MIVQVTCPNCNGSGKIITLPDNTLKIPPVNQPITTDCGNCEGTGFISQEIPDA